MSNTNHLKRHRMPNTWRIKRKGVKFIQNPNPSGYERELALSMTLILRDYLKLCRNLKEVKYAIKNKEIFVNGKKVVDDKHPVGLFEVVEIKSIKESYRVVFDEVRKLKVVSTKNKNILLKVSNKKVLKNKKFQINTINGFNILVNEKDFLKIDVSNSLVYDFEKKNIVEILKIDKGQEVYVFGGRFIGKVGVVVEVKKGSMKTKEEVTLKIGKDENKTIKKYCIAISKNVIDGGLN